MNDYLRNSGQTWPNHDADQDFSALSAAERVFGDEATADALDLERKRLLMIAKLEELTGPMQVFGTGALARPEDVLPVAEGGEQVTLTPRYFS